MLANELVKIISNSKSEDAALKNIKMAYSKKLKGNNNLQVKISRAGVTTTPLISAAQRGFTRVVKYLVEDQQANPNIPDMANQTALDHAIIDNHIKTAEYLASITTVYCKDIKWGYTSLHLAAGRDQVDVVRNILAHSTAPINDLSRERVSALHLATENGALESIKLLVDAGADPHFQDNHRQTAYGMSLGLLQTNVVNYLLNKTNASAVEVNVAGISYSPLKVVADSENPAKLPAIITLLEAGAGLDLNRIPIEIYTALKLFGQIRDNNWDCLIVGTHNPSGALSKLIFITSVDKFIACLNDPEYTFKLDLIKKSLQHPVLRDLTHLEKLANIIHSDSFEQPSLPSSSSSSSSSSEMTYSHSDFSVEELKKLDPDTANLHFRSQVELFCDGSIKVSTQIVNCLTVLAERSQTEKAQADFDFILTHYLKRLNEILYFSQYRKLKDRVLFEDVVVAFRNVYSLMYGLMLMPEYNRFNLTLFSAFADNLREVIHTHAKELRAKYPALYNSLLDAHAISLCEVAWNHLKEGELELAQTLATEALYHNSKLTLNNKLLAANKKIVDARCFSVLAQIDIREARFHSARNNIGQALELAKVDSSFDCRGLSEAVLMLLEHPSRTSTSQAIGLVESTLFYLTRLKQDLNHSMLRSEFVTKELEYEQALQLKLDSLKQLKISEQQEAQAKATAKVAAKATRRAEYKTDECLSVELTSHLTTTIAQLQSLSIAECSSSTSSSSEFTATPVVAFTPRADKVKTRGLSHPELDKKRKKNTSALSLDENNSSMGFDVPPGYIQPVPIVSDYLANNHLFVTMPENHSDFSAFYKLVEGNEIRGISQSSLGQQGVKLGKAKVQSAPGEPYQVVAIARLKVCGGETVRPWGYIEQAYRDPEAGLRKLYVFRPEALHDKKDEYNRGYRP